jgi:hypothetical protein
LWSQVILAGSVPVYLGAPNIVDFAPAPNSYLNFRDFVNAEHLANTLKRIADNPEEYASFFEWKKNGLFYPFRPKTVLFT